MSSTVDEAAAAVLAGGPVIVPTDTVYGLDVLFDCIPELHGRAATIARALLPGAYTLVLANPAERFRWLTGPRPHAIGVRVPALEGPGRELLDRVGALAATSANLPGGPDPRLLADVPGELRAAAAAELDGGALPGTASTVLDCTGREPIVLRAGAASVGDALRRLRAALG